MRMAIWMNRALCATQCVVAIELLRLRSSCVADYVSIPVRWLRTSQDEDPV